MPEINVKSIIITHLKINNFDGLCNEFSECGCEISDLMPCEDTELHKCKPGHKVPCPGEDCNWGGDCDWHMMEGYK